MDPSFVSISRTIWATISDLVTNSRIEQASEYPDHWWGSLLHPYRGSSMTRPLIPRTVSFHNRSFGKIKGGQQHRTLYFLSSTWCCLGVFSATCLIAVKSLIRCDAGTHLVLSTVAYTIGTLMQLTCDELEQSYDCPNLRSLIASCCVISTLSETRCIRYSLLPVLWKYPCCSGMPDT